MKKKYGTYFKIIENLQEQFCLSIKTQQNIIQQEMDKFKKNIRNYFSNHNKSHEYNRKSE